MSKDNIYLRKWQILRLSVCIPFFGKKTNTFNVCLYVLGKTAAKERTILFPLEGVIYVCMHVCMLSVIFRKATTITTTKQRN